MTVRETRTATLSDTTNPLSLLTEKDSVNVNGSAFVSVWDATARTLTSTSAAGRVTTEYYSARSRPDSVVLPGVKTLR
jgi:hypothetical protein